MICAILSLLLSTAAACVCHTEHTDNISSPPAHLHDSGSTSVSDHQADRQNLPAHDDGAKSNHTHRSPAVPEARGTVAHATRQKTRELRDISDYSDLIELKDAVCTSESCICVADPDTPSAPGKRAGGNHVVFAVLAERCAKPIRVDSSILATSTLPVSSGPLSYLSRLRTSLPSRAPPRL